MLMTDRKKSKEKLIGLIMAAVLLLSMLTLGRSGARMAMSQDADRREGQYCVVIDAGHGGSDPGKVGINGSLEKDVNLEIAKMVEKFLVQQDVRVIMTRTTQEGLYDKDASNKKVDDMKKRIAVIEQSSPDMVVSIHQNSYHEESVCGPQVFYYTTSTEGRALGELLQEQIIRTLQPEKERAAKGNDSYYLLKKTKEPIVIVECGFLSNREEAEKLCSPAYQEKVAWAVHLGILRYLNGAS